LFNCSSRNGIACQYVHQRHIQKSRYLPRIQSVGVLKVMLADMLLHLLEKNW
jgi:hypothetical protein